MNTSIVFLLILFAALCHAGWSTIVKHHNSFSIMGMTCIVEIIVFTPLVFFVPFPPLEIWYFIIASVILHGFYRLGVIYSYKFGDLSFVYPIARGGSSLLIAILTLIVLQEYISLLGFAGILTVCIGIFLISYSKNHKFNLNAFILALCTALLITIYTIVDGMGVRLSENKFSYLCWLLLLNGVPLLLISIFSKEKLLSNLNRKIISRGIPAGILAILSYGIVVWSMQYLEIAYVSSIRETSIVLATLMGFFILNEKKAKERMLPAVLVVIGITIVYFQI
ncbi:MAG: EamA family transporter [Pelagibacteraceae bacterium]|nr:EamA family transporter [Pelagibacteraceae bacterium]MBO6468771.1 EamA family transporter [Pelagibacteraceae bacterium]MBO6469915.1 EamA family transporter [Pelagibacteraceae bacterium]MDP6783919.1 GRP family sugar transporter [Alphaproteobacteria bacterium]